MRDDAGELGASVAAMTMRVERIEAARPSVEAVARDLASLSGTHEAVRDGLEQVRMAYTEMTRLRERHTEADAWLAETDRKLTTLRGHATELQGMRPLVDALRGQVDRVTASEIDDLLLRVRKRDNTAMMIVTHDTREARRLGDRIGVLNEGNLIAVGGIDELAKNQSPLVRALVSEAE